MCVGAGKDSLSGGGSLSLEGPFGLKAPLVSKTDWAVTAHWGLLRVTRD